MTSRTLSAILLTVALAGSAAGLPPLAANAIPGMLVASALAQDFKLLDTRNPNDRKGPPSTADLRITMEFQGGNVADYVQALVEPLRDVLRVNAVIDPAADNIRLSPVQLKELPLDKCFELIPQLRLNASDPEPTVSIDREATGANSLLVRVSALVDPATTETQVQVFSIGRALAGLEPDDARKRFESAIETMFRMLDEREPRRPSVRPRVSLHQESGTLVVLGTQDQLHAIAQLVERMANERLVMNEQEERRRDAEAERNYARNLAKIDLERAAAQLEFGRAALEETEQVVKLGNAPSSELAEQRLRLKMAELEVQRAKAKLESVEQRGNHPSNPSPFSIDPAQFQSVPRNATSPDALTSAISRALVREASTLPPEVQRNLDAQISRQQESKQTDQLDLQSPVKKLEQQVQSSQAQINTLMDELLKARQVIESLQAELNKRKPQ